MKMTALRLVGANTVDLPIVGADPSGPYLLKAVDGLGPVEVDVLLANTRLEGGVRQGRRPHNRQIVARIGIQPDWNTGQTPEELRTELYGLLTTRYGQPIKAQILDGATVKAEAEGDISKFELALFAKDPEVQISINCDHPYLLAPAIVYQYPTRTVSGGQTLLELNNDGTAPSGFWMSIQFQEAVAAPLIITDNSVGGELLKIKNTAWAIGDILTIDTRPGSRGVWRTPTGGGATKALYNNLSDDTTWLQLYHGLNQLTINSTLFDWVGNGFGHTPAYWGV